MLSDKRRRRLLILFISASVVLGFVHYVAIDLSLYWIFPHLDIVSHLLGGVVVALGTRIFLYRLASSSLSKAKHSLITLSTVLAVGIAWEVFEFITGTTGVVRDELYVRDTATDLFMDMLGGALMLLI